MADRIQLLRSLTANNAPSGLLDGEPAVNLADHCLYIGGGASGGYPLGCQSLAWPRRSAVGKIVGDVGGTALTTLTITSLRQYFVPFVVPRRMTILNMRFSVTTAVAGLASVGIYGSTVNGTTNSEVPGTRLVQNSFIDTGSTGDKSGLLNFTIYPGRLYWAAFVASAAVTVRALAVGSVHTALGRATNGTAVISYLYAAGSDSTLPNLAPTALTEGTGNFPALYLVE